MILSSLKTMPTGRWMLLQPPAPVSPPGENMERDLKMHHKRENNYI
jgi:hypothetical protein